MQICGVVTEFPGQLSVNLFLFFLRTGQNKMTNDIETNLTIRLSNSLIGYILEFLIEAH